MAINAAREDACRSFWWRGALPRVWLTEWLRLIVSNFSDLRAHLTPRGEWRTYRRTHMSEFYKYFKENMEALGLPAPNSLFGTLQTAIATASTILSQIDKYGPRVTIRDLAKGATRLEQLTYLGSVCAAFYVGAVIGSIAVATGRSLAGGTSIVDVLFVATRHDLNRSWLLSVLQRWPAIYDSNASARNMFRFEAVNA